MDRHYGGVIWTDHALKRLQERQLSQAEAWATWKRPDNSRWAQGQGAWIYFRTIGSRKLEVVAKKNDRGEWVIISVWSTVTPSVKKREVLPSHTAYQLPLVNRLLTKLRALRGKQA